MGCIDFHLGSISRALLKATGAQTIRRVQTLMPPAAKMQKEEALCQESLPTGSIGRCKIQEIVPDKPSRSTHRAKNTDVKVTQ